MLSCSPSSPARQRAPTPCLEAAGLPRLLLAASLQHYCCTSDRRATRGGLCVCPISYSTCITLLPLQTGRPGRVVHVSSKIHFMGSIHRGDLNLERGYNSLAAYGQSKLAQVWSRR